MAQATYRYPPDHTRPWVPQTFGVLAAAALLASASVAAAGKTPEQKCQEGRYHAAAKYHQCQQKAMGKLFTTNTVIFSNVERFNTAAAKCLGKYTGAWAKLQKKASGTGSTCDSNTRYVSFQFGTITDLLTGLQWEMKTDDGTVHDKGNAYSWSTTGDGDQTDADGTVFTSFLAALNTGGCFAGQCDWRLPTIYELQTILLEPYPCGTSPCVYQFYFGSTASAENWSSTTIADYPARAWLVDFYDGFVYWRNKTTVGGLLVRAVRGGL